MSSASPTKQRVDQLLVERGLVESRSRAQALVMSGKVFSGEVRLDKPGQQVSGDIALDVRGKEHPWVSRGGMKLAHALDHFELSVEGCVCLDVGASTGGFTDVLLKAGAAKVFAIDVGRGQLDWSLRNDERVVVFEGTNARYLTEAEITDTPSLIVCDASFIGLRTVLPASLALGGVGAYLVALIKPQFEVGKGRVGKGGVVRDAALHDEVCETIRCWLAEEMGWAVLGIVKSPITGPKGNIEFLIVARKPA
jgi:23S rRNA (cytidine1920-2'-O)/16S rRNA (cytidine1409-2'-O)-methyltransferase